MVTYSYTAFDSKGHAVHGKRAAEDLEGLREGLRREKMILVRARAVRSLFSSFRKISAGQVLYFTTELKMMLESGIDIIRALAMEEEETEQPRFREMIADMKKEILGGKTMGEAFEKYRDVFGAFYVNYIRIGETSGTLTENIGRICLQMETEQELKRKVREAMFYPAVIFSFSTLVIIFLVLFVLPNFAQMFEESETALPLLTRALLYFGNNLPRILIVSLPLALALPFLKKRILAEPDYRYRLDRKKFHLPLLGEIFQKSMAAALAQNFSLLINSGMVITEILEHLAVNTENSFIRQRLKEMKRQILSGGAVGSAVEELTIFPKNYLKMIRIGEESGKLAEMFEKIYQISRENLEQNIKRLLIWIEPLLILFLGTAVGIVITAIYLPIFSMSNLAV